MREFKLKNEIKTCIKINKDTPRIALTLNFSVNKDEKFAGEYLLMSRLLLKGTLKYSSKELASILDENAIDLSCDMKYDYLRFRFVSLNEDFEQALSIMADIIKNSTFDEFEKEKIKLKSELSAELDSARVKVSDLFISEMYKNHYYGHSYTATIEQIDNVKFEDIKNAYSEILKNSFKTIAVVGDIDISQCESLLDKYLSDLPLSNDSVSQITNPPSIEKPSLVEFTKQDAQQAQIIRGWRAAEIHSEDYPALMLLNVILGASGLSSRLFNELREKKGLAYTVRSSYETHFKSSVFSIYIGTAPTNIETSIAGFNEEIKKIKEIPVSEQELHNAINNLVGKQQFITETNSQQANLMAYYSIAGFSFDYQDVIIKKLNDITPEQIKVCANKYFTKNHVTAIIKP